MMQARALLSTTDGAQIDYDSLVVLTLVEEDGKLKVLDFKDFSDPEKRKNTLGLIAKGLAKRGYVA
jgi:hypothetical protein